MHTIALQNKISQYETHYADANYFSALYSSVKLHLTFAKGARNYLYRNESWETFNALTLKIHRAVRVGRERGGGNGGAKGGGGGERTGGGEESGGPRERKSRRGGERARYMYTERTDIVFQIGIRGIGLLGSK